MASAAAAGAASGGELEGLGVRYEPKRRESLAGLLQSYYSP
jgi:hypothetical protein